MRVGRSHSRLLKVAATEIFERTTGGPAVQVSTADAQDTMMVRAHVKGEGKGGFSPPLFQATPMRSIG
jgi:hypothetical protein